MTAVTGATVECHGALDRSRCCCLLLLRVLLYQ